MDERRLAAAAAIERGVQFLDKPPQAKPGETAPAVERLQKEAYLLKGRVSQLEERDFAGKAAQLADVGAAAGAAVGPGPAYDPHLSRQRLFAPVSQRTMYVKIVEKSCTSAMGRWRLARR